MRIIILGFSALALSACSFGGVGFGAGQAGYITSPSVEHGNWQGYTATPDAPVQSPCYEAYKSPCSMIQPGPVNYSTQYLPTPAQHVQPTTPTCGVSACANGYNISSYGHGGTYAVQDYYDQQDNYLSQAPSPYTYFYSGEQNLRQMRRQRDDYFYGTFGGVLYDTDAGAAGLQARLGYQSAYYLGAEVEGSLGILEDGSTANISDGLGGTVTVDTSAGVESSYAGFGTVRIPLGASMLAHGRLGYHQTKTYLDAGQPTGADLTRTTDTFDGLAYGAGIELALSAKDAIRADFTRYEGDMAENDSVSIAYLRRF